MKKLLTGLLIILIAGGTIAHAEMRIWTDKKGNSIEAEFIKIFSGKVVLKTKKGKQIKIPKNGLSQKDLDYLKNAIPPKIDIEVNINTESKNMQRKNSVSSINMKQEKIKSKITITKKNRDQSNKTFTACFYLFTKNQDSGKIKVIDKKKYEFSFATQSVVKFDGNQITVHYYKNYYSHSYNHYTNYGEQYEGYLVIIEDAAENIICTKGSRSLYEDKASLIRETKKGSLIKNLNRN